MKTFIFSLVLVIALEARAENDQWLKIWSSVKANSPELSAAIHRREAAKYAASRASFHFLPSLSAGASAFSTNNPGSIFFSNLSQRKINANDLSINTLNQPGRSFYKNLNLGIDLPIYEGGAKTFEADALNELSEAEDLRLRQHVVGVYTSAASEYTYLLSAEQAHGRISFLKESLAKIISRYSIGSESNPVGYSGFLGLKSLRNRIEGALIELENEKANHRSSLSLQAKQDFSSVKLAASGVGAVLGAVYPSSNELKAHDLSIEEKISNRVLNSFESKRKADRARYLPKLGLFANENLTQGDRDLGTNQTVGVYLQWLLFDPSNINRLSEAEARKDASQSESDLTHLHQAIDRTQIQSELSAVEKNYALLLDSEKILDEQAKVAMRLFQSGSISALQLTEVLNRRVDLILNLKEVESRWIRLKSAELQSSSWEGEL